MNVKPKVAERNVRGLLSMGGFPIKRILLLLCAILIIVDLADDGCLGKAPLLAPQYPEQISLTDSLDSSGDIAPQCCLAIEVSPGILKRWQEKLALVYVGNCLINNICYGIGSSGGLPW
jgi:hypothetical protein